MRWRTGVRLDASSDFSGADIIKVRDVLTKDSLQVTLPKTLGVDLSGVDPDVHVQEGACK